MKLKLFFLIFLILGLSQISIAEEVTKKDRQSVEKLVKALKTGDKATVASLISYPLSRLWPLKSLENETDFKQHYEEYFDVDTIAQVVAGSNDLGNNWQGTALGGGLLWFDDGKIIRINLSTQLQKDILKKAREEEKASLHPSARNYETTWMDCKTSKHHLRIQSLKSEDLVHYYSWKVGDALSTKPEIELTGTVEFDGSGGNKVFKFKNGKYSYEVYESVICGDDCNSYLTVKSGVKILSKSRCE